MLIMIKEREIIKTEKKGRNEKLTLRLNKK